MQWMALIAAHAHANGGMRVSVGPYGWVEWVQLPRLSAGFGWVHGHAVSWWQTR